MRKREKRDIEEREHEEAEHDVSDAVDEGLKTTGRGLMLIVLLAIVLTVGWSIKPVRVRIWDWIRNAVVGKPPPAPPAATE